MPRVLSTAGCKHAVCGELCSDLAADPVPNGPNDGGRSLDTLSSGTEYLLLLSPGFCAKAPVMPLKWGRWFISVMLSQASSLIQLGEGWGLAEAVEHSPALQEELPLLRVDLVRNLRRVREGGG